MELFFDQWAMFSLTLGLITVPRPSSSRLAILAPPPRRHRLPGSGGPSFLDRSERNSLTPSTCQDISLSDLNPRPLLDKRRFGSNPSVIHTLHYFWRSRSHAVRRCKPHSLVSGSSHHHRPARWSSQALIARVQGAQPYLESPDHAFVVRHFMGGDIIPHLPMRPIRQGLILTISPCSRSISTLRASVRVTACSRRRPVIQPSNPFNARLSGSTLRMPQHSLRCSIES